MSKKRRDKDGRYSRKQAEKASKEKPLLSKMIGKAEKARSKPRGSASHLIVRARAGTGKTFTLVEGLNRIMGKPTKGITPSPQQAEVWASMLEGPRPRSSCFIAFNKSIALELAEKVPEGSRASTIHSQGFITVAKALAPRPAKLEVKETKYRDCLEAYEGEDFWTVREEDSAYTDGVAKLLDLVRLTLALDPETLFPGEDFRLLPPEIIQERSFQAMDDLCLHYGIELNGAKERVFLAIPHLLDFSIKIAKEKRIIDYTDMIWLPLALNLPIWRYDLLGVDEAQDLGRCQQQLALRMGDRIILCGDDRQAIYGFAGADTTSLERMEDTLSQTARGCNLLPLTVTRRCCKAVVDVASTIVPDFEAFSENPQGNVSRLHPDKLLETVKAQVDRTEAEEERALMILCRVNAPLVSCCFRLLRNDVKATIQGKEIGKGLISLINRMGARKTAEHTEMEDLIQRLEKYFKKERAKEQAKETPSEARLISLEDKEACLMAFMDGAESIKDLTKKIKDLFSDEKQGGGVLLSSIHKAKGLEADTVYILEPGLLPHPMARTDWQAGQEENLRYVAITRAIQHLIWVE